MVDDIQNNLNDTQHEILNLLYKEYKAASDFELPPYLWAMYSGSITGTTNSCEAFYSKFNDDAIDSWPLTNSLWPICIILVVYLTFVLKLGPKLMENRHPINIKYILIFYNIIQIIFNSFVLIYVFSTPGIINYLWNNSCHPDRSGSKIHIIHMFDKSSWCFAVSKIIDLLDTVFFVLKKKQSHVSFLHVYHHVNMVITCFIHLKFIRSENAVYGTIVNSFVHLVMYTYYFLSSLGPSMEKYLWWKKYLTRIQIIQFIFGIFYCTCLFVFNCSYPKLFIVYMLADIFLFLYMFLMFYKKTYKHKDKMQ